MSIMIYKTKQKMKSNAIYTIILTNKSSIYTTYKMKNKGELL